MWPRRIAAVVRMLVGGVFAVAGVLKLTDSSLLYGGVMQRLEAAGAAFPFYGNFLLRRVEPNQEMIIFCVAGCEIFIGLSFLSGGFVSYGAAAGAVLLINYALATAYGDMLRLMALSYAVIALLMLGRGAAGLTWGADKWLVGQLPRWLVLFPLRISLPDEMRPAPGSPDAPPYMNR
jgi:uncharacterized membrane protein YphA (DoxX/SURF4 family)